ncbi:MAG: autotransporter-associated beta strand repeat-containing protein [Pirellulaceae bacterium]
MPRFICDISWKVSALSIAAFLLFVSNASGQAVNTTMTWNQTGAGAFNYTNPGAPWTGGGFGQYPSGLDAVANVNNNILGDQTINVNVFGLNLQLKTFNLGDSTLSNNFTFAIGQSNFIIGSVNSVGAFNSQNGTNTVSSAGTGVFSLGANSTFQHTTAAGSLVINKAISNGAFGLTIGGIGTTTLGGVLGGGAGGLTKNGAGNLNLNAANTYTGLTTINAGTVTYGVNNAIFTGGVTVNTTGTLALAGFSDTVGQVIVDGGSITGGGTLSSTTTFDVRSGSSSATLGGAVGLTKTTAGSFTLSNTNSYSGTTAVNSGMLILGHLTDTLANTGAVSVNGGTLSLGGNSDTVGAVTLASGTISGTTGVLTGSSYSVQDGTVSAILGGGAGLTKSTGGTVTMSNANTYTGATILNAGILNLTGSLGALSAVTVNSTATLNVDGTVNGATTVAGGNANVNATGTVNGLTLNSGSVTLATSSIVNGTVNMNGGTLSGTGTMNGPVTVLGGTVLPGTSPGTLFVNNSFTLGAGATLVFDLNGGDQTPGGANNDLITGVTNLTLDGTLNIVAAGSFLSALAGDQWRLFNYTGALTNNGLNLGTTPTLTAGYYWVVDTSTANQVNLMAVPEPGSMAVIFAAGMAGLIYGRRRRVTV